MDLNNFEDLLSFFKKFIAILIPDKNILFCNLQLKYFGSDI